MGILFFDWYGYRLLTAYWQKAEERRVEAWLNMDDFGDAPMFYVKMPVSSLSYYNSTTDFERVDGQILIDGIAYKFVKRRLFKDSLELIVTPDLAAIRRQTTESDFFRQVNDLEPSFGHGHSTDRNATHQKNHQKDYSPATSLNMSATFGKRNAAPPSPLLSDALQPGYRPSAERPPDYCSSTI